MKTASKVGRRGQLVIPKAVRRSLDLREGQRVAFVWRAGTIALLPLTETLSAHKGSIRVDGPQDFDAIREEVKEKRAKKRAQAGELDGDT